MGWGREEGMSKDVLLSLVKMIESKLSYQLTSNDSSLPADAELVERDRVACCCWVEGWIW